METVLRWIDLNGVATRRQAWTAFGLLIGVGLGIAALEQAARPEARFLFPVLGAVSVVYLCTMVRRLHDTGVSGYWALTLLIPGVGVLTLLYCLLRRTTRRYVDSHPVARGVGAVALTLLALASLARVVWMPFWIPSESMKPTLLIGDYLLVNQRRAGDVQRGDIVVFRHPVSGGFFIVRVIGLPGDRVQMWAGAVVLNGAVVPQVAEGSFEEVMAPQGPQGLRPRCENDPVGEGGRCTKSIFRETLPGGSAHRVLNIDTGGFGDDGPEVVVPAGHLFLLGDNRDNSQDSRYNEAVGGMGFVPVGSVIGRADRIVFSAAGRHLAYFWTWRSDRVLKAVE